MTQKNGLRALTAFVMAAVLTPAIALADRDSNGEMRALAKERRTIELCERFIQMAQDARAAGNKKVLKYAVTSYMTYCADYYAPDNVRRPKD